MQPDDDARFRHMRDAARKALEFADSVDREAFEADEKSLFAIIKCIEIIGEAAARISSTTKDAHPSIPWATIVGMRNRLIHAYFEIDVNILWETVKNDLPAFVEQLDSIIDQSH